jgi:amidophosphoribosyltransferase
MPTRQELVAFNKTEDEVAEAIGADQVIYQNLDDLVTSVAKFNRSIKTFDVSVFNGCYVTGDVSPEYLMDLEKNRDHRRDSMVPNEVIGLYNNR